MKNKKRFLSILVMVIVLFALSVSAVACNNKKKNTADLSIYNADGELAFDKDHHALDVEYGTVYAFPMNAAIGGEVVTATLALYDESDNQLTLAYGSYTFKKVGEYRAVYTANDKTLTVNVNCRDTVAPIINVVNYALYGVQEEVVSLPTCTFSDLAGIDESSITYTVTDPDGAAVTVTDGKFTLTKIGKYRTTVSVRDNNGVSSEQVLTTECFKKYIDTDRADKVIYSFNNEDYLDLVRNVNADDNITREIVKNGYPAITGEESGNAVLKMTSDKVYGDVRTKFWLHEDLLASSGRNIIVRFAVDKDTDYIKLYRSESEMTDKGTVAQMFGLKAGQWYEMTVCPISFGYNLNFKDFIISYRDVGGVTMYIDSIIFDGEVYVPDCYTDSGKTVIADFGSDAYGVNLYQNIYSQPTTTMGRVDGTVFELLPEGNSKIPAKNKAGTSAPNDGARGGVLHGTITALYGGLTYMFPEPLDLDKVNSLAVHMYAESEHSAVVFGFFDGRGFDSAVQRWYDAGKELLYTPDQWREYVFSNEMLRRICGDGKVSGIYLYCYLKGDATAYPDYKPGTKYTCDFYLDEITVRYKENPSEQQNGTIATFENGELTNVRDNWVMDNTAKFEIKDDGFGADTSKVLSVTSNGAGDGFIYLFDETVELKEGQFIQMDLGLDTNASFTTVDVGIVYAKDLVKSVVSLEPAKYTGDMQHVILSYEQVRDIIAAAQVQGIHVTTTATKGSKLYVDNICVSAYDATKDKDLPTVVEVADSDVCLPLNTALDLSSLKVTVTDPSDPDPTYKVVSVTDPSGAAVTVTNNKFIPAKAGEYTVTVRGVDAAKNESTGTASGKLNVRVYDLSNPAEKRAYYAEQLKFELPSSMMLVSSAGLGNARLVDDKNATGGRALEVTFGSFVENSVTIDLGGVGTVGDIQAINIRFRVVKQKSTDVIYLNDYTEQMRDPENPESNTSHIAWFDYTQVTYGVYTSTQQVHMVNRKIPLTALLNELHICSSNVNGDPTGKILIDYIEIVYDDQVAPTVTVPTGTQKLEAKYGAVDLNELNVKVEDNLDNQPVWEVVSLKQGDTDITANVTADKKFPAPTEATTYTLKLVGVDAAGNRSDEVTVTFSVELYVPQITINANNIMSLISGEDKTAHAVKMADGSVKANLYPLDFKADENYGALKINIGTFLANAGYTAGLTVNDIEKLVFKIKFTELTSAEWDAIPDAVTEAGEKKSGGIGRFYLNGNTAQNGESGPHHIAWIDTSGSEEGKWRTQEASATNNIIGRGIPATEKLEYIQIAGGQWNAFYNLYIDSITIVLKGEEEAPVPTETEEELTFANGGLTLDSTVAESHACKVENGVLQGYIFPKTHEDGMLRINLTGLKRQYKVSEIEKITFHISFAELTDDEWAAVAPEVYEEYKKSGGVGHIFLNDNTTQNGENGPHHIAWLNTSATENEWQVQESPAAGNIIGRGIAAHEKLEYIQIAGAPQANAYYKVFIDSVTVTVKAAVPTETEVELTFANGGLTLDSSVAESHECKVEDGVLQGYIFPKTHEDGMIRINLTGLKRQYKVSEIEKITFHITFAELTADEWAAVGAPEGESSGGVGHIFLNDNTTQNGENGPHHIAWLNTSATENEWQIQESPADGNIIGRGISAHEKLEYIQIAGPQFNSYYKVFIDSVKIMLKAAAVPTESEVELTFANGGLTLDSDVATSHACKVENGVLEGYIFPKTHEDGMFRINLTGLKQQYKVREIEKITFHISFAELTADEWTAVGAPEGESSGGVGHIFLNDNTTQNGENGPHHIAWLNTSATENEWQIQESPAAGNIIGRGISADDVLEYIQIAGPQFNSYYKVFIDSVKITFKA